MTNSCKQTNFISNYHIGVYYEHNNNFDLGQNYFLPNLELVWPNSEFVWPRSKSLIIYHC